MTTRTPSYLAVGAWLLASGCATEYIYDDNYCARQGGDLTCRQRHGDDKPYCAGTCFAGRDFDGCVEERPADDCYHPCGVGRGQPVHLADDPTLMCAGFPDDTVADSGGDAETTRGTADGSSTTSDDDGTTTAGPSSTSGDVEGTTAGDSTAGVDGSGSSESTAGPECDVDDDCADQGLFCLENSCVACGLTDDGSARCAERDADAPVCFENACVQCTADAAEACGGTTPLCDDALNACVPCRFHFECREIGLPACHIAEGSCFSGDVLLSVSTGTPNALSTALAGSTGPVVLEVSGNGEIGEDESVTIDDGRVVAVIAASGSRPTVRSISGPTVAVSGAGSTLYLEQMRVAGNLADWGIVANDSAAVYVDESRIVQNSGGGLQVTSEAAAHLRNCFLTGPNDGNAVRIDNAQVNILYSTLGNVDLSGVPAVQCTDAQGSEIRNSIVASQVGASALSCEDATLTTTVVTDSSTTPAFDAAWFGANGGSFSQGDFSLQGNHPFADQAIWQEGDPPFDIDLVDDRPTLPGTPDVSGADVP